MGASAACLENRFQESAETSVWLAAVCGGLVVVAGVVIVLAADRAVAFLISWSHSSSSAQVLEGGADSVDRGQDYTDRPSFAEGTHILWFDGIVRGLMEKHGNPMR